VKLPQLDELSRGIQIADANENMFANQICGFEVVPFVRHVRHPGKVTERDLGHWLEAI
jgi:hypothetical protein